LPGRGTLRDLLRMSIASTIKSGREKLGLSQEKLGKLVGVTKTAVHHWEMGKSAPTRKNAPKVARVLGVKISEISEPARVGLTLLDDEPPGIMIPIMAMGDFLSVALHFDEADLSIFPNISADVQESDKAIALRVDNADMADEVNAGDVIVVSLATPARDDDLVVAHVKDSIVLRRYRSRGYDSTGQAVFDLVSPNPEVTTLTVNRNMPGRVLAVVLEHRKKRRA
jgi:DNA-binding XRE family transcriptional regulator